MVYNLRLPKLEVTFLMKLRFASPAHTTHLNYAKAPKRVRHLTHGGAPGVLTELAE